MAATKHPSSEHHHNAAAYREVAAHTIDKRPTIMNTVGATEVKSTPPPPKSIALAPTSTAVPPRP
jgi:hypothetical protein